MTRNAFTALLFSVLLASVTLAEPVDTARIADTLEVLRTSVNDHDYERLEPALADAFTYQGREADFSRRIMRQVVGGYPQDIAEISILSIAGSGDGWTVAARLTSPAGMEQRTIRLDHDYRLLQADIADIRIAGHGGPAAAAAESAVTNAVTVPFRLVSKLIVVDAAINGVAGNYLVDTGAQAIVLNSTSFSPETLTTVPLSHEPPTGVGGVMEDVRGASGLVLDWGAIHIDGLRAIATDLTHLEDSIGVPITGIIGFNVLERFELHFNYADRQLTLLNLDDAGRPLAVSLFGEPLQTTPFEMARHLPVLPVEIAGIDLRLGLDSGAGGGMLFERWQTPLQGKYTFITRDELRGGDRNVQMGDVVRIGNMRMQSVDYPDIRFRFNDMAAHYGEAMPMDGLLGYDFLSARPTSINFRLQELKVWESRSQPGAGQGNP